MSDTSRRVGSRRRREKDDPLVDIVENAKGISTLRIKHWKDFDHLVKKYIRGGHDIIYRGQALEKWKLEPLLDRKEKQINPRKLDRQDHLWRFVYATRGRYKGNPQIMEENDWWALGRHFNLATPLLDWTESPFVALFFAFWTRSVTKNKHRIVFGLHREAVSRINTNLEMQYRFDDTMEGLETMPESSSLLLGHPKRLSPSHPPPATLKIFPSYIVESPRMVAQRGWFSRGQDGVCVEEWITLNNGSTSAPLMFRIQIADKDQEGCLRYLNRMNINENTLFPDLSGAAEYCNRHIDIHNY